MPKFQLTIAGDNFLFSRLIDYNQVKKVSQIVMEMEKFETSVESFTKETSTSINQRIEIAEFIQQSQAQRIPDKITAIAFFLKEYQFKSEFTKDDLNQAFEEAMIPLPKNLARDIRWAEKIGWIAQKGNREDSFYLTTAGKQVVEQKFPKELSKKTAKSTLSRHA